MLLYAAQNKGKDSLLFAAHHHLSPLYMIEIMKHK